MLLFSRYEHLLARSLDLCICQRTFSILHKYPNCNAFCTFRKPGTAIDVKYLNFADKARRGSAKAGRQIVGID